MQAQDIVKGVNQVRNLDLYYAAVTTVIPTAAVVAEQFELPQDEVDDNDEEESHQKMNKKRLNGRATSNLIDGNATVTPNVDASTKANEENKSKKLRKPSDVYSKDEVIRSREGTKHRTNTYDHGKRTTNKSKEKLIALENEVQLDIEEIEKDIVPQIAIERTLPSEFQSGDPEFVNTENYDIYEFFEEDEDETDSEDEDEEEEIESHFERTRRDASEIEGVTWQSLQRLAELAAASNPDLSLINLVTPNPDIEITIEVLSGVNAEEHDDQLVLANEVAQTKPPRGRGKGKGKGKKGKGKNKKDKDKDRTDNQNPDRNSEGGRITNIPDKHTSEEEKTNQPVDNGEVDDSSYSYHIGGPLLPFIPDNFEDFNFPEGEIFIYFISQNDIHDINALLCNLQNDCFGMDNMQKIIHL